jgi:hypothetical protein
MRDITYTDTITIVLTAVDGYGSEIVDYEHEVAAVFEQNTGYQRSNSQSAITSDARAVIDPTDDWVVENFFRLEGALVVADIFGAGQARSFYRIRTVDVGRDHQLGNQVDNVVLALDKAEGITGVS